MSAPDRDAASGTPTSATDRAETLVDPLAAKAARLVQDVRDAFGDRTIEEIAAAIAVAEDTARSEAGSKWGSTRRYVALRDARQRARSGS